MDASFSPILILGRQAVEAVRAGVVSPVVQLATKTAKFALPLFVLLAIVLFGVSLALHSISLSRRGTSSSTSAPAIHPWPRQSQRPATRPSAAPRATQGTGDHRRPLNNQPQSRPANAQPTPPQPTHWKGFPTAIGASISARQHAHRNLHSMTLSGWLEEAVHYALATLDKRDQYIDLIQGCGFPMDDKEAIVEIFSWQGGCLILHSLLAPSPPYPALDSVLSFIDPLFSQFNHLTQQEKEEVVRAIHTGPNETSYSAKALQVIRIIQRRAVEITSTGEMIEPMTQLRKKYLIPHPV